MPATSHDLKGLLKFLARDEWHGCLEAVLDDHFGMVLEGGDMEFQELAEVLGDDQAMTLWGCAFEDFLTQDFEVEGGNIVDAYLKRRGWKESAQAKAYMRALRTSVMSLYEVSDIVPGKSLMARDLIRGGEPIPVSEATATQTLKPWDRIAARIVAVPGKAILAGGLLSYTPQATDALFEALRLAFGEKDEKTLPTISDQDLQSVAFLFTTTWLLDALGQATTLPSIQNSDGDDLVFHDVRFPLAKGVKQKDIAVELNAIPGLSQENAKFWNWLEVEPKSAGKVKKADRPSIDPTMDNGQRVLGNLELKGRFLHLLTNSAARAERGTVLIGQALGENVGAPLTEIRTVEQMMAEQPAPEGDESASDVSPELAEHLIHDVMDRHYRETLDVPVSMLGNKTPRQAAGSAAGRQKLAEWLKYLENQISGQMDPTDPMSTYSFEWLWKELGVEDLRR